jgi:hypothetical protein
MKAPYKAIEFILEQAPKFAEAKAQRVYIENFLRTKKALLMKEALTKGIDSGVAQEREAYAHPEYQELLRGLQADFFENWCGGTLARIDSPEAALRMIGTIV